MSQIIFDNELFFEKYKKLRYNFDEIIDKVVDEKEAAVITAINAVIMSLDEYNNILKSIYENR